MRLSNRVVAEATGKVTAAIVGSRFVLRRAWERGDGGSCLCSAIDGREDDMGPYGLYCSEVGAVVAEQDAEEEEAACCREIVKALVLGRRVGIELKRYSGFSILSR